MATAARTDAPRPMKAEEMEHVPRDVRAELVDGVLVMRTPAKPDHGSVAIRVARTLGNWADEHGAGEVFDSSTGFILARDPDVMRSPDVAFVSAARLPAELGPFLELGPDLVVEALSRSNTMAEMVRRVADYFRAGTRLVWLVDVRRRRVAAWGADEHPAAPRWLDEDETLDGGDVLPGLTVPIAAIFAGLRRPAPDDAASSTPDAPSA